MTGKGTFGNTGLILTLLERRMFILLLDILSEIPFEQESWKEQKIIIGLVQDLMFLKKRISFFLIFI